MKKNPKTKRVTKISMAEAQVSTGSISQRILLAAVQKEGQGLWQETHAGGAIKNALF